MVAQIHYNIKRIQTGYLQTSLCARVFLLPPPNRRHIRKREDPGDEVAGLPTLLAIEAFSRISNSFYVLQTDVIPTFGLTFSQIDVRLYRVQKEQDVFVKIPCSTLFANALRCIENARQGVFPETPDKRKALDKLCKAMSKFSTEWIIQEEVTRLKKFDSESKVNLHIADTFLMALIDDGQCVVNASHGKDAATAGNPTVITPDKAGWKGLGIETEESPVFRRKCDGQSAMEPFLYSG
ncbi:uncharacterized protein [Montipora foliosa]|uniref:uncharacterized protein n=1 Tax=Montipora foliosa TaxID=591990 RepID=UPI0035F1A11D